MAGRDRRGRWVRLGVFDVVAIVFVIGLLGVSLAALLAIHDARLAERAGQWLRIVAERIPPVTSMGRAEASPSSAPDPAER